MIRSCKRSLSAIVVPLFRRSVVVSAVFRRFVVVVVVVVDVERRRWCSFGNAFCIQDSPTLTRAVCRSVTLPLVHDVLQRVDVMFGGVKKF